MKCIGREGLSAKIEVTEKTLLLLHLFERAAITLLMTKKMLITYHFKKLKFVSKNILV